MNASDLVAFVEKAHSEKWGYVLTGQGELYTEDLAISWIKSPDHYPHAGWSWGQTEYFTGEKGCKRWYGHRVADCSGLIVAARQSEDPGYGDRRADDFKKQFTESGVISTLPEIPGLALWRSGHIGVYIGNGWAIEARGYSYGVVKTRVANRTWTHWGKILGVDYEEGGDIMLQKGSEGNSVGVWQKALKLLGHDLGTYGPNGDGIDNDFGSMTEAATEAFQRSQSISETGKVDVDTMAAMILELISRTGSTDQVDELIKTLESKEAQIEKARAEASTLVETLG